jgi:hypothetical protein
MISSRYPQVTDELLSAYLDQAVSDEEKKLVEEAVAAEPTIAWRLETLRQTVQLLRSLPALALPRSFVLTEVPEGAGQAVVSAPAPVHARRPAPQTTRAWSWGALWAQWRAFWQVGSPLLRNAAAVSFALFLIVVAGDLVTGPAGLPQRAVVPNTPVVPTTQTAIESAPSVTNAKVSGEESAAAEQSAPAESADAEPVTAASAPVSDEQPAPAAAAAAEARPLPPGDMGPAAAGGASISAPYSPEASDAMVLQSEAESGARRAEAPGPDPGVSLEPSTGGDDVAGNMPAESISALLANKNNTATATVTATLGEITAAASLSDTETITLPDMAAEGVQAPATPPSAEPAADAQATEPAAGAMTTVVSTPAVPAQSRQDGLWLLQWLQVATALLTLIFVALWWRSRTRVAQSM